MAKVKVQRKSKGQTIQKVLGVSFDIHLTFEICHLKLIYLSLFHMPETGIVHRETEKTVGAHLGRDLYPYSCF
jgi:hypothetical protein